jgi:hypothetical protein
MPAKLHQHMGRRGRSESRNHARPVLKVQTSAAPRRIAVRSHEWTPGGILTVLASDRHLLDYLLDDEQDPQQAPPERHRSFARTAVEASLELFPSAPPVRRRISRGMSVLIQVVVVLIGVVAMLGRVSGIPAWDGVYAEDYGLFLPGALARPWHLLVPYAGYVQLGPRLIAQLVTYLPLRDAAAAIAVAGALIACLCALFIFHAGAGLVRSPWLRGLLALAVVLLPVAPLEIPDSAVDSPWYMMMALFFATLWRPRTRTAMAIAAIIGFMTAASEVLAIVLLPLLLIRVIALPRVREHAVTLGWLAGCLLQLPYVLQGLGASGSRVSRLATFPQVNAFYGHDVVMPALGWHLSWQLQSLAGRDGATLIVGALLATVFAYALITQGRQARVFLAAALLTGYLETVAAGTLSWWVPVLAVTLHGEAGSRYTDLPILLIDAALILTVDSFLRRTTTRPRAVGALIALIAVLCVGWIPDYRYLGNRSNATNWPATSATWLRDCDHSPTGVIRVTTGAHQVYELPCSNLRRLGA